LAGRKSATAEDLSGQRLLTLDTGHRLARIVYGLAAASGGIVSDDYEGTSLDSILLMAATGAGVAVIPDLFARIQAVHRREVVTMPLKMADATRVISLMFDPDQTPTEDPTALAGILRDVAGKLDLRRAD
jgi:LysR family hydrogen peroxide-inducible transcriptional activator